MLVWIVDLKEKGWGGGGEKELKIDEILAVTFLSTFMMNNDELLVSVCLDS